MPYADVLSQRVPRAVMTRNVVFVCPRCTARIEVPASAAGTRTACASCAMEVTVPVLDPAAVLAEKPDAFRFEKPRTSAFATVSLVMGILGLLSFWVCCALGPVAAVMAGHVAYAEIMHEPGAVKGKAMAVAGLVLGYIGVTVSLALIAATVFIPDDMNDYLQRCRAALRHAPAVATNSSAVSNTIELFAVSSNTPAAQPTNQAPILPSLLEH